MSSSLSAAEPLDLTPASIAAYLQGVEGWSLLQDQPAMQIWTHGRNPTVDEVIHLPTDSSYDDYDDNLRRVMRHLQRLHDWDARQLTTQVLAARSDVLYVRAAQSTRDGSIPVREAQQLLDGAVDMITAAARATYAPRRSFSGRLPDAVKNFVDDDLRMGHTQRGSFVMTILTRLDDEERAGDQGSSPHEGTLADGELELPAVVVHDIPQVVQQLAPFGRRVMSTLASGLSFIHQAVEQPDARGRGSAAVDLDLAAQAGVSAQLCGALEGMTDQEGVQLLDLSFTWAPAEPSPHPDMDRVVFDRPDVPVLRDLSERLAPALPGDRPGAVVGYVVRLERGQDAEEGAVTVEGTTDDGTRRNVRLVLAGSTYATAVAAHNARGLVEARGVLRRVKRQWILDGKVSLSRLSLTPSK